MADIKPTIRDYEIVGSNESGTQVTVKAKPMESVCYENTDLLNWLDSADPPELSPDAIQRFKDFIG